MASLTEFTAFSDTAPRSSSHLSGKEAAVRILCFAIPVLIAIEVPGLGTIYLAELCLIGLLPVLLVMRGKALLSGPLGLILLMGMIYFGTQVITDIIRETPFGDYARGWSRIMFFLMSFVSCFLLTAGNRARILCYAGGLVLGSTIYLLTHNPLDTIGWKFGFAGSTTTLMLMGFMVIPVLRSPRSLVGPMIMVALGIFSAFMDFRSWGGILMVSAAFLSVPAILRLFGLRPKPLSYGRMLIVGMLLLGAAFGALKTYGWAAESGLLGEKSKDKYEAQSALGDIGIVLGGRNESLVTVQAIMDSPLIGHGSWAKDRYYAELRQLMLYKLGFLNRFIEPENDLIPTHSHLLGAWVEAGLGGALFWLVILGMIMATLRRLYASNDKMRPYLTFLMFLFIWDILFSPFGAQRRLTNGFLLVAMLYGLRASTMDLRSRISQIAIAPVNQSWANAAMRSIDHRAALGLGEPRPVAWQASAGSVHDDDDEQDFYNRDPEQDDPSESLDQEMADDEQASNGQSTDLGAGGETIRAGFQRLRQRTR